MSSFRAMQEVERSPYREPRKGGSARRAWATAYEGDEIVLGGAVAFGIHALPVAFIILALKGLLPTGKAEEVVLPSKPVIAASILKLGKPLDPNKLPDRLVPRERTAPKQETVASREQADKQHKPDAGPPPPLAKDSDLRMLVDKSEPFAENDKKVRPEEGHAGGLKEGTETDPNKVKAGDMYAAQLAKFIQDRWAIPTVISDAQASRLCVVYKVAIGKNMVIWHLGETPLRASGNELFDDSARTVLQKLLDDHTPLPEPPAEVAESFRGRAVHLGLQGRNGDPNRCK